MNLYLSRIIDHQLSNNKVIVDGILPRNWCPTNKVSHYFILIMIQRTYDSWSMVTLNVNPVWSMSPRAGVDVAVARSR